MCNDSTVLPSWRKSYRNKGRPARIAADWPRASCRKLRPHLHAARILGSPSFVSTARPRTRYHRPRAEACAASVSLRDRGCSACNSIIRILCCCRNKCHYRSCFFGTVAAVAFAPVVVSSGDEAFPQTEKLGLCRGDSGQDYASHKAHVQAREDCGAPSSSTALCAITTRGAVQSS